MSVKRLAVTADTEIIVIQRVFGGDVVKLYSLENGGVTMTTESYKNRTTTFSKSVVHVTTFS